MGSVLGQISDPTLGHDLRGVSVSYFSTTFIAEVQDAGLDTAATITELEPIVIRGRGAALKCPRDGKIGAAFVDCLSGVDNVGLATHMLSYSWGYSVGDIAEALEQYCGDIGSDPKRTYVWMCCLCINQHHVQDMAMAGMAVPFEEFKATFASRVCGVRKILCLMAPWQKPLYLTRAWCVFEIYTAITSQNVSCDVSIIMPPRESKRLSSSMLESSTQLGHVWNVLAAVKIEEAEASVLEDRERILKLVEEGPGYNSINDAVSMHLQNWFLNTLDAEARQTLQSDAIDKEQMAKLCVAVARLLRHAGQADRAMTLSKDAIVVISSRGGLGSFAHAILLAMLGAAQQSMGNLEDAVRSLLSAKGMCERTGSLETAEGAWLLKNLAVARSHLGDARGALQLLEQAKHIYECIGKLDTADGAELLLNLAGHQDFASALPTLLQAKEIRERSRTLETPQGAWVLHRIGELKWRIEDLDGALVDLEHAEQICKRTGTLATADGVAVLKSLAMLRMFRKYK